MGGNFSVPTTITARTANKVMTITDLRNYSMFISLLRDSRTSLLNHSDLDSNESTNGNDAVQATGDMKMDTVTLEGAPEITTDQLPANDAERATAPLVLTPDQLALVTGGLYVAPPVPPTPPRPGIFL
jgi:hypothetical protein